MGIVSTAIVSVLVSALKGHLVFSAFNFQIKKWLQQHVNSSRHNQAAR